MPSKELAYRFRREFFASAHLSLKLSTLAKNLNQIKTGSNSGVGGTTGGIIGIIIVGGGVGGGFGPGPGVGISIITIGFETSPIAGSLVPKGMLIIIICSF